MSMEPMMGIEAGVAATTAAELAMWAEAVVGPSR